MPRLSGTLHQTIKLIWAMLGGSAKMPWRDDLPEPSGPWLPDIVHSFTQGGVPERRGIAEPSGRHRPRILLDAIDKYLIS